jgi:hypothetical protein
MPKFVASLSKRQSQRYVRRAPCAPHRDVTKDQVLERDGKVPLIKCNVVWVGEQPGRRESNPIIRSPACLDCLLASTRASLRSYPTAGKPGRPLFFWRSTENPTARLAIGPGPRARGCCCLFPPGWPVARACTRASCALVHAGAESARRTAHDTASARAGTNPPGRPASSPPRTRAPAAVVIARS